MATILSKPQPIKETKEVKNKIQKDYQALFSTADAIAVSAALRLVAITEEIAVLEAERTAIKSIVSDIGRYNLGTAK